MAEGMIGGTPISQLPPSSFAYCEPGDEAVSTRCHFPIRGKDGKADAAHVRNALARLSGSPFEAKARAKVEAAAKELGIGQKALGELKAEPMTTTQLDRWLSGKVPRRVLMLPFGGPLPGGRKGKDLDGEYFDADTDIYGPFAELRRTRERLVDWHHDNDPTGVMKGAELGRVVFDAEPEDDGTWADFWANAGERRRALIARLERGGVPLYGSSEAVRGAIRKADDGHIEVWPVIRHTITTSPQNPWAVVPPLKALLTADLPFDEVGLPALHAALLGLDEFGSELGQRFLTGAVPASPAGGDGPVKAGRVLSAKNEAALKRALDEVASVLALLAKEDAAAQTP